MNPLEAIQIQTQSMMRKLFLHYKAARALLLMYILVEAITLILTTAAAFIFEINPVYTFAAFISLSALYTFFFLISFSYFLYNVIMPKAQGRYF